MLLTAAACGALQGCTEQLPDGPRVPTFPVSGQVMVDGRPAEMLSVKAEPAFEKPAEVPASSAFTDKEGRFSLSTFESGDGLPSGKYKLTFMWGQFNLLNGQYTGPDKLKGRYRKAESSTHEVNVEGADKPIDLGVIELTTK